MILAASFWAFDCEAQRTIQTSVASRHMRRSGCDAAPSWYLWATSRTVGSSGRDGGASMGVSCTASALAAMAASVAAPQRSLVVPMFCPP